MLPGRNPSPRQGENQAEISYKYTDKYKQHTDITEVKYKYEYGSNRNPVEECDRNGQVGDV